MADEDRSWSPGGFTASDGSYGYIDNNGRVSIGGTTVGYILPNGTIEGKGGINLGHIAPDGTVYSDGGAVEGNTHNSVSGAGGLVYGMSKGASPKESDTSYFLSDLFEGIGVLLVRFLPVLLIALPIGLVLLGMYYGLPFLSKLGGLNALWWIIPLIVGIGFLIWASVVRDDHERLSTALKWIALPVLGITLTYLSFFKLGLGAVWAFPLDFMSSGEMREELMGFVQPSPAMTRVYEWFIRTVNTSDKVILNHGMAGIFDTIEKVDNYFTEKLPVLIAFVLIIANTVLTTAFVILMIPIVPIVCLLFPFLPPLLLLILANRVLFAE